MIIIVFSIVRTIYAYDNMSIIVFSIVQNL